MFSTTKIAGKPHTARQIEAFEKYALVGAAVADEADADAAMAELLGGERRAANQRRRPRRDPVRPIMPFDEIGDMHRTALAAACAGRLAVDFGHHFLHVDALGDAMAVPSVGRGDSVADR